MRIKPPDAKPGDVYLLFNYLPYDYEEELPILIGPSVCLDNTPCLLLDSAENGLADYLLPGYSLMGTQLNHCCLRCFSDSARENLSSKNLLFLALLCLRLYEPLRIEVRGQFRLGENGNSILEPSLQLLTSPWHINDSRYYTSYKLEKSALIMERLINVKQLKFNRLISGLTFFGQVTLGLSQSYQLSYLGLFAALESLFVPVNKNYITLAERASNFLSCFDFPEPINTWLKDQYIGVRNNLAHGIDDATLDSQLRPERKQAFSRLHEITRLALLGFLSMDDEKLKELDDLSGIKLQSFIDNIKPAKDVLLSEQKCFSS